MVVERFVAYQMNEIFSTECRMLFAWVDVEHGVFEKNPNKFRPQKNIVSLCSSVEYV